MFYIGILFIFLYAPFESVRAPKTGISGKTYFALFQGWKTTKTNQHIRIVKV